MDYELEISKEVIDPTLLAKIKESSQKTYIEVAQAENLDPDDVYKLGKCEQTAKILRENLRSQNIETNLLNYSSWDISDHYFLEKPLPEIDDSLVIDLNWHQFLDKPNDELPKSLIVLKSNLVETLTKLGIPKEKQHFWLKAIKLTI